MRPTTSPCWLMQRAAAVAGVDRGVGLDHARPGQLPLTVMLRSRPLTSPWVRVIGLPIGKPMAATWSPIFGRCCWRSGSGARERGAGAHQGQVVDRVGADHGAGGALVAVDQADDHGLVDDVVHRGDQRGESRNPVPMPGRNSSASRFGRRRTAAGRRWSRSPASGWDSGLRLGLGLAVVCVVIALDDKAVVAAWKRPGALVLLVLFDRTMAAAAPPPSARRPGPQPRSIVSPVPALGWRRQGRRGGPRRLCGRLRAQR